MRKAKVIRTIIPMEAEGEEAELELGGEKVIPLMYSHEMSSAP